MIETVSVISALIIWLKIAGPDVLRFVVSVLIRTACQDGLALCFCGADWNRNIWHSSVPGGLGKVRGGLPPCCVHTLVLSPLYLLFFWHDLVLAIIASPHCVFWRFFYFQSLGRYLFSIFDPSFIFSLWPVIHFQSLGHHLFSIFGPLFIFNLWVVIYFQSLAHYLSAIFDPLFIFNLWAVIYFQSLACYFFLIFGLLFIFNLWPVIYFQSLGCYSFSIFDLFFFFFSIFGPSLFSIFGPLFIFILWAVIYFQSLGHCVFSIFWPLFIFSLWAIIYFQHVCVPHSSVPWCRNIASDNKSRI